MAFDRSRNNEIISIGEAFEKMLKSYNLQGKFKETQVCASWEKVMGKFIASKTEKVTFKKGILYVKIDSPPLRQELTMSRETIKKKLNTEVQMDIIQEVKIF